MQTISTSSARATRWCGWTRWYQRAVVRRQGGLLRRASARVGALVPHHRPLHGRAGDAAPVLRQEPPPAQDSQASQPAGRTGGGASAAGRRRGERGGEAGRARRGERGRAI